ncbi:NnrU family protein [Sinirhodobacter ferrireducens]|uniref:NnrU family protein n=1 Tax=Paenirhodobacter ferrireducens TaxID=1215032 RepID=A0A443LBU1_9RHOB|nr:NnrU family protein [Sinirhodobacter ferrireducens]RWR46653.1 NnrU family protein [Sinirhodobacter ferrireducens]
MAGWGEFLLAGGLFMASHLVPANARLKTALVARLGRRGWVWAFSLTSTALLFWLIFAAGHAPAVVLWMQQDWMRWLANLVMPVAIVLVAFGIGAPNPFAFEGRATGFDPDHPGIAGLVRQPLLWALVLWSSVHLLVNGDLAHVILFGAFLIFSATGMRAMEGRKRRAWGAADFARLAARTSSVPFQALLSGRWRPAHGPSLVRLGLGLLAWVTLWHLHAPVIGVTPLP